MTTLVEAPHRARASAPAVRILCATDGSDASISAARLLDRLPLGQAENLTLLTVGAAESAKPVQDRTAAALSHTGATLHRAIRRGHAADEILRAAEEWPTGLIVMGHRSRSGVARVLLGSTAERVARHAKCPVLIAHTGCEQLRRVVVGVDGSDGARRAAEWLARFPLPADCEVRLVSIVPNLEEMTREGALLIPPLVPVATTVAVQSREEARAVLETALGILEAAGLNASTEIRSGDPGPGLVQVALDEGADLVVVGSHGMSAVERFFMGSVSEFVLRNALCSVLIVR